MSGTSLDGIDVALVRFAEGRSVSVLAFETIPYAEEERARLLALAAGKGDLDEITRAHTWLGARFGAALADLLARKLQPGERVRAVGSHGQTIWHHPPDAAGYGTFQIGSPFEIAERTGLTVVSDFRLADMAAGGHGAPLVPVFLRDFFRTPGQGALVQNVGGIGNLAWLDAEGRCRLAFDTGPGNMISDALMRRHFGRPYDADGAVARTGKVHAEMLQELLRDDYVPLLPPKSTGRERYGEAWVESYEDRAGRLGLPAADRVATAVEFAAWTMAEAYRRFLPADSGTVPVVMYGGGAHNRFLVERLAALAGREVVTSERFGVPPDAVEAVAFAYMALLHLAGAPGNVPEATGARRPVVLGSRTG